MYTVNLLKRQEKENNPGFTDQQVCNVLLQQLQAGKFSSLDTLRGQS